MGVVEFDEFKGNKIIVIKRDENDEYAFRIGRAKAKLIMDNIEAIKKFAEEED